MLTAGAMLEIIECSKKRLLNAANMLNDDGPNNASQCSLNAVAARPPSNAGLNAIIKPPGNETLKYRSVLRTAKSCRVAIESLLRPAQHQWVKTSRTDSLMYQL